MQSSGLEIQKRRNAKRAATRNSDSLAVFGVVLALVRAEEELAVEQLDCYDSENELEREK